MELIRRLIQLFTTVEGITEIIEWGGLLILVAMVFAETGLLAGFFLPGDSLLFIAGFLAGTQPGLLSLWYLLPALCIAAIVGDSTGYYIGKRAGAALYNRPQSRFFRRDHLLKTKAFYEKYGGITIVVARFMPFARTFAPVVAGVAEMEYRRFLTYNVMGGIGWVCAMSLLGYFLGSIQWVRHNVEKVTIVIIILSLMPVVIHAWRSRQKGDSVGADQTPSRDDHRRQ